MNINSRLPVVRTSRGGSFKGERTYKPPKKNLPIEGAWPPTGALPKLFFFFWHQPAAVPFGSDVLVVAVMMWCDAVRCGWL